MPQPTDATTPARPFDLSAWQSRQARLAGVIVLALLALFGAAMAAWIHARDAGADGWPYAFCSMPALAGAALLCTSMQDARQALLRFLVALMFGPILLLFWAAGLEPAARARPDAQRLDVARLEAGARAVQSIGTNGADVVLVRAATYADGTELRITRLVDAEAAEHHLAFLAQGLQGRPQPLGERPGLRFLAGSGVVHAERHGTDLLQVHARDEAEALARLSAQGFAAPDPAREALEAPTPAAPAVWPVATAAGGAIAIMVIGFLLWAARRTTEVPPAPGVLTADEARLRARMVSLPAAGVRCRVSAGSPGVLQVDLPAGADRHHQVLLTLHPTRRCVRVIERLGASGAAPADADEADMRSAGEGVLELSPPDAQRVWSRTRQATMIRPDRFAALSPRFDEADALQPSSRHAHLNAEGTVTLLCAVVTGSGWRWQPSLF
jgi:hypothetical protein